MFFTEDHEYIRDLARQFADKELAPIAGEIDQKDEIPQRIYDMMADMGFFGLRFRGVRGQA
jgi:alkylation response protein AidB-like acyl-CoA dehydrogenase